ncbi:MAG: SDR family NAD(P)-dependent oxidoreductase [Alphaproteobacteria bacterium]
MRFLITGAASGLGRALAERVIADGGMLVAVDRDGDGLAELEELSANRLPITAIRADLACTGDLAALSEKISENGPYDWVILNAGISATGLFEGIPIASQADVIAVNLTAPMVIAATLVRDYAIRPGSMLVFVASLSIYTGYPGAAAYGASKQGLAVFAKSLAGPLAKRKINVLTVLPGPLDTPHAARHAPPGTSQKTAARRMAPDAVARDILGRASRSGVLVPGAANKATALLGTIAPRTITALMRKVIFEPFERHR